MVAHVDAYVRIIFLEEFLEEFLSIFKHVIYSLMFYHL